MGLTAIEVVWWASRETLVTLKGHGVCVRLVLKDYLVFRKNRDHVPNPSAFLLQWNNNIAIVIAIKSSFYLLS